MKSLRLDIPGLDKSLRDKAFVEGSFLGFVVGLVVACVLLKVFGRLK